MYGPIIHLNQMHLNAHLDGHLQCTFIIIRYVDVDSLSLQHTYIMII